MMKRAVQVLLRSCLAPALLLSLAPSVFGASITGTVTDGTSNSPSAGDDVVLLSLAQNMQEIVRTKTDHAGHYRIDIPDAGMHLIRVDHEKAAYYAAVAPGASSVDVTVYDVTAHVVGLSTEADMVRIDTDDQGLHVIESYFLKNESIPPRTQFSSKAFEIYLPGNAKVNASIAMGPGGMPVATAPVPLEAPGHDAFVFPIRPGETRFQVEYHLPPSKSYVFQAQVSLPTANYAVVLPQGMTFTPGSGALFGPMSGDPNTHSMLAKNLTPGKPVTFAVSGAGTLPQEAGSGQAGAGQTGSGQASTESAGSGPASTSDAADTRPGGGMAPPIDTPDPLDKYKWWIISGIGLVLVAAAGIFLKARPQLGAPQSAPAVRAGNLASPAGSSQGAWLAGIKDELFALETERLQGTLPDEEYRQQKQALEIVMKRALSRQEKPGGTPQQASVQSPEPS